MRIEWVVFAIVASVTACGLVAPPGEYGSEYTNDDGPRDASSEDGD